MNKKLQKIILECLLSKEGTCLESIIIDCVNKDKWSESSPIPSEESIRHQSRMLRDKGKIKTFEQYPWGYL